jgi:predicted RNA-binding protein YlxR (DUF448 family)
VRLVVGPSAPFVAVDLNRRLGGRGVSVHPRRACIRTATGRGALAKALRGKASIEPERLARMIVEQLSARVAGLLSAAARTRSIALGTDAVRAKLQAGRGSLLVTARDARGRSAEITSMATAIGCATARWGTKAALGEVFSRPELGVFLVTDRGIAKAVLECLAQIEALSEDE